ncbi:hypothetical protein CSIM01_00513 [Colletotrichum simmondsii]|uniref:Uncharacterized protein n=1 Tax=Colletotrichum simmondsii TaxID=703756 RepID=A0A135SIS0_9PEZI|nr:hypothetical protein CSIM01_00513 [Colletotrichum simmondsii]
MASADEYSLTAESDYDGDYSPQGLEEAGAMQSDGEEEDDIEIDGITQGTRRRGGARSQAPTEPEEPRPTRPARRKVPKRGRSPSVEVVLPDRTKRKKTNHPTSKSDGFAERSREEDTCHSSSPEPTEGHVLWDLVRENLSKMPAARVREYMDETHPILTKRQLDHLFPKKLPQSKYDEDWTEKDEKKLQEKWKNNIERELLVTFEHTPAELIELWKVWLRIWHISPQLFISKNNNMKFDTSIADEIEIEKDGQLYKRRPAIWSEAFCRSLHHLSLHPIWAKNLGLLVTALQYASVLRTKNYQDWPLSNNTNDNFLAAFIDVIDKYKGQGKPLYELHGKTRERITKQACDSSLLSNLMLDLEEGVVPDPEAEPRGNGRKFRPYKISIQEIDNLNRALANSTYRGRPRWGGFTPKEFAKITAHGRRPLEEFPDESTIAELYERAILKRLRWEAKNKNQRARLNVPKTEPYRRPNRCEKAYGDYASEEAQLREDLAASRRRQEEYRAELRAQSRSEMQRRATEEDRLNALQAEKQQLKAILDGKVGVHAKIQQLQAENQELKGRLGTGSGDRSMVERILQEEVDFTRQQYEKIKAGLQAPREGPAAEENAHLEELQAENQKLQDRLVDEADENKKLQDSLAVQASENARLKAENQRLQDRLKGEADENKKLQDRLADEDGRLEAENQKLRDRLANEAEENQKLEDRLTGQDDGHAQLKQLRTENRELKKNVSGYARIEQDLRNSLGESNQSVARLETVQAEKNDLETKLESMEASAKRLKKKNRKLEKKLASFRLQTEAKTRVNEPSDPSDDLDLGPENTNPGSKETGNGKTGGGNDGDTEGGHNEPLAEQSEAEIFANMLAMPRPKQKWRHRTEYYRELSRDPLQRVTYPEYV